MVGSSHVHVVRSYSFGYRNKDFQVMSPFRDKTWEFIMTPFIMLAAGLVHFIAFVAPVGYLVSFEVRALSEDELWEFEEEDDE